jgi:hypothetical protein
LCSVFGVATARADTIYVPTDVSDIQGAIWDAQDLDTIIVLPGTYFENVLIDKPLVITSIDPTDPAVVAATVVDGRGLGPVVTFAGAEAPDTVLTGFTITNGLGTHGGGLYEAGYILNCTIVGNQAGGLYGGDAVDWIENCIIWDNRAVNLTDVASWADCMTGPNGDPYAAGCEAFDFEFNADVDLVDFGGLQVAIPSDAGLPPATASAMR